MTDPAPDRSHTLPRAVIILTLAAIALRLLLFLGRGSYVAFDEGWYLLLGRSLWSGGGYSLSGLTHVALSPLFPILAGGLGRVLGDPVWAGRIVASVASGLLVLPAWAIFRRLASHRVALLGVGLVTILPSLAPFVVPYWIGWDLWVGAEPLLHLFLFTGVALFLRAWESRRLCPALACGAAFALAYLARPEAIGALAVLGLVAAALGLLAALRKRIDTPPFRRLAPLAIATVVAFAAVAAPYWIYLHGELGRWTLTGRAVQITPSALPATRTGGGTQPINRIEDMLWRGDAAAYVRTLYALDPSGTRLANGYWGVQPEATARSPEAVTDRSDAEPPTTETTATSAAAEVPPNPTGSPAPPDSWLHRYTAALGVAVPWYVWVFVLPGVLAPIRGRRLDLEALVAAPLAATSLLIVRIVAIDPRTQLFIAPLAAFYAARGVLWVGDLLSRRLSAHVRPGLPTGLLAGSLIVALLTTSLADLTLSLTVGSPHHIVAEQNRAVGEAIREATPEDATVVSFHPAIALFADRDWRVLPLEPMPRIVRYASTLPDPYLVLSVFYPPEVRPLEEPHYLIVPVPEGTPDHDRWRIDVPSGGTVLAFGRLVPEPE